MNAIARPLRQMQGYLRAYGLAQTVYHALSNHVLPARLVQFGKVAVMAAGGDGVAPVPGDPGIREATADDAPLFEGIDPGRSARWKARIEAGEPVWVLLRDGRMIGAANVGGDSRRHPDWLTLEGAPGDVWLTGTRVAPQAGAGTLAAMLRHAAGVCAARGHNRLLGIVDTVNRNARQAYADAGYRPLGTVFYLRLLNLGLVRAGGRWRRGRGDPQVPMTLPVDSLDGG
jgi:hypothetical protein